MTVLVRNGVSAGAATAAPKGVVGDDIVQYSIQNRELVWRMLDSNDFMREEELGIELARIKAN